MKEDRVFDNRTEEQGVASCVREEEEGERIYKE
jgi:hypothetical protein